MQQTETYKLNLIETGDTFSPLPINENMEKVEEALEAAKAAGLQVATGSYTGTGTYGSSNKNTLTFPFTPLVVFIAQTDSGSSSAVWLKGVTNGIAFDSNDSVISATITWGSKSVSWYYSSNALYQLNASGKTYLYLALGFN